MRLPCCSDKMRFRSVVLPEPKKPVRTVTGTGDSLAIETLLVSKRATRAGAAILAEKQPAARRGAGETEHQAPEQALTQRHRPGRHGLVEGARHFTMDMHDAVESPAPVAAGQAVLPRTDALHRRLFERLRQIDR